MTEKSWPWSTVAALGDGASELGESDSRAMLALYFGIQDPTSEGVSKGVLNELEVTGTASPLQVDTGAGICYGLYFNDAAVNVTVPTPSLGTTGGRIVLQTNWAGTGGASLEARTRIALKSSADGNPSIPALTQSVGTTWEISLATFTITTGGVIAVTDDRTFRMSTMMVDTDEIHDDAVTQAKIANNAVGSDQIATGAVDSDEIATGAVDSAEIAANAVGVSEISTAIAGDGLTGGGGSALAVNPDNSTVEISSDQVRVKDLGITNSKIANDTITNAKIADRTRRFLVMGVRGWNETDSLPVDPDSNANEGLPMVDNKTVGINGEFFVPIDFGSSMTVTPVVIPASSGNLAIGSMSAWYGSAGQNFNNHSNTNGPTVTAIVVNEREYLSANTLTLSNVAAGDYVSVQFRRLGASGSDTIGATVYFHGFLVEYTADS